MRLDQIGQPLDVALTQRVVVDLLHCFEPSPAQQRRAGIGTFEQAVQVCAEDLPIGADGAIAAPVIQRTAGQARADPVLTPAWIS